jgi:hypothetical protein
MMVWEGVHSRHFMLFLPLHPPVLKPNLDLPFRQAERVGNFYSAPPRQVAIEMKFFFQFQCLVAGIRRALTFCFTVCVYCTCINEKWN